MALEDTVERVSKYSGLDGCSSLQVDFWTKKPFGIRF